MQTVITLIVVLWLSQIAVILFMLFWTKGIERDFDRLDRKARKIQNGYESYFRTIRIHSDSDFGMDDTQR